MEFLVITFAAGLALAIEAKAPARIPGRRIERPARATAGQLRAMRKARQRRLSAS